MDELSPLFQEIEFHERWRGYDPDEVDAYMDRVARAAAVLRGRLVELHERVEAAEARGPGSAAPATETEETLTRTLVLAQRTADAAIAEAREEANRLTTEAATSAASIVASAESEAQVTLREAQAEATAKLKEAEDRAALVMAEAETDRRTMVEQAEAAVAQASAAERERLADELSELRDYREFLADDVAILERHVADERHQLAASLSALTDLLESPEAFRSRAVPELSDPDVPAALLAADAEEFDSDPVAEAVPEESVEDVLDAVDAMIEESTRQTEPADELASTESVAAPEPAVSIEDWADSLDARSAADLVEETAGETVPIEESPQIDEPVVDEPMVGAPEAWDEPVIDLVDESKTAFAGADETAFADADETASADADEIVLDEVTYTTYGDDLRIDDTYGSAPFADTATDTVTEAPPRLVTAADLENDPSVIAEIGRPSSMLLDPGPATEQIPLLDAADIDDSSIAPVAVEEDSFLAQLRDAVDTPAPTEQQEDEALSAFFDQEEDDGSRSWFGRRR